MSVHDIIVFSPKIENPCTLTGYKHISIKDINSTKHLKKNLANISFSCKILDSFEKRQCVTYRFFGHFFYSIM